MGSIYLQLCDFMLMHDKTYRVHSGMLAASFPLPRKVAAMVRLGAFWTLVVQDYRRMVFSRAFALGCALMLVMSAGSFLALDIYMLSGANPPAIAQSGIAFQADSGIYTYHLPPVALCFIAMRRLQPFLLAVPPLIGRVVGADESSGYGDMRAVRPAVSSVRFASAAASGSLVAITAFILVLCPVVFLCHLVSCGADSAEYFASIGRALADGMPAGSAPLLYDGSIGYACSIAGVMCAVGLIGLMSSALAYVSRSGALPVSFGALCALSPHLPFYAANELISETLLAMGTPADLVYAVDIGLFGSGFPVAGILNPSTSTWVGAMAWMLVEILALVLLAGAAARVCGRR